MGRHRTVESGSRLTVKELRHTSNNSATRDGNYLLHRLAKGFSAALMLIFFFFFLSLKIACQFPFFSPVKIRTKP